MNSELWIGGKMDARLVRPRRAGPVWRLANLGHTWRGTWRGWLAAAAGIPTMRSDLHARVLRADGTITDYGRVGTRVVTTAFVTALATYMFDVSGVNPAAYDYHASGTGANAEAIGDTALQTDAGVARVNGTPANPGAGQYRSTATISYTSSQAITEHGLFSAAAAGTLLDRTVFAAINVVNGDSIQFTYTLTISAGG